jgi:hypothetical protein
VVGANEKIINIRQVLEFFASENLNAVPLSLFCSFLPFLRAASCFTRKLLTTYNAHGKFVSGTATHFYFDTAHDKDKLM